MHESDWDTYWKGAESLNLTKDLVNCNTINLFWKEVFGKLDIQEKILLDIASGNGAVLKHIPAKHKNELAIFATDISHSALKLLSLHEESCSLAVADARNIPLPDESINIITSQFGIEYAGLEAFKESFRLAAKNSRTIFVLHHANGEIYKECNNNLQALDIFLESEFIEKAHDLFSSSFQAIRTTNISHYQQATSRIRPAIKSTAALLKSYGVGTAGGLLNKTLNDFFNIHDRIEHYQENDLNKWIERLKTETLAYQARMRSMTKAAIDKKTLGELSDVYKTKEVSCLKTLELINTESSYPVAWVIDATKSDK